MVERISVQIALEGGDAIEKQLADIGEAGKKAFADIQAAADKAGGFQQLKPDEGTKKLNEVGLAGTEAFGKIQAAVSKAAGLETMVEGVPSLETAFVTMGIAAVPVIAAIAAGLTVLSRATISFAADITKAGEQATSLGQTIGQFDKLRAGLEQVGVSGKGLTDFFTKLKAASQDLQKASLAIPGI